MQIKMERIEARLHPEQKALFIQAAALEGMSLSEFVISNTYEAAKRVIQENESIALTTRDKEEFVKALLEDIPPHPRLKKAAERYKKTLGQQ